jgi:hypothetical protein
MIPSLFTSQFSENEAVPGGTLTFGGGGTTTTVAYALDPPAIAKAPIKPPDTFFNDFCCFMKGKYQKDRKPQEKVFDSVVFPGRLFAQTQPVFLPDL